MSRRAALVALLALTVGVSCGRTADTGEDPEVTTRGTVEVTARLTEIADEFPPNKLYDYAFVMKYEVIQIHRGEISADTLYIAHYNPLKPRNRAADARVKHIGGNLRSFREGDIHRIALETPLDAHFLGGVINPYFADEAKPIHWAVWTNSAGAS